MPPNDGRDCKGWSLFVLFQRTWHTQKTVEGYSFVFHAHALTRNPHRNQISDDGFARKGVLTKGRATCSVSNEHLPPADNSWNRVEKEREGVALQGALGFRCKIRLGGILFDGFLCAPKQGVPSCPSQFWFQVCSARSMFGVLGSKKRCGRVQPGWDVPGVCEQKEGATKHWRRVSAFGFLFSTIATLKSRMC